MKQLQEKFKGKGQVRGFEFTQIEKSSYGYIYEVNTGDSVHYEVFKHNENTRFDTVSYPSNKAFGLWAWSYSNLDKAKDKFDDLEVVFNNKINL